METLTSNFHKQTRRETLHGREFVVAPITLIVPGILKGSQGALFYSAKEIAKSADAWNAMPITLKHPTDASGKSVSGRTPAINEKQGIGTIYNSHTEKGNLVGEAWFDLEATREITPSVAESLERNQPIELSTGLFTDNKKAPEGSEHKGQPFSLIATNIRPDHLAILPDQVGACSLEDGCGVLNETTGTTGEQSKSLPETIPNNVAQNRKTVIPFSSEKKGGKMPLTKKQKTELVAELIENCEYCDESDTQVLNELSDEKLLARQTSMKKQVLHEAVVNAVQDFAGEDVEPSGLAAFVVNQAKAKKNQEEEDDEDEKEKERLAFLKKSKGKAKNTSDDKEDNVKNTVGPKTDAEWLAEAPTSVQNTLKYAQQIEDSEKQQIVSQIVANVEDNEQKKTIINRLKDKGLDELRDLALLTPPKQEVAAVSYRGAQGAPASNQDDFDPNDILETPVMNFAFADEK